MQRRSVSRENNIPKGLPYHTTNWPTKPVHSRGGPWVALLAVALLGYLTRTGFQHFIVGQRKLLEVLLKARGQVRRLQIIRFLFFPRIARDEYFTWNIWTGSRGPQSKDWIFHLLNTLERSTDSRSHHRPGIVDINALTYTIWAACPPGVDQVAAHFILLNSLT